MPVDHHGSFSKPSRRCLSAATIVRPRAGVGKTRMQNTDLLLVGLQRRFRLAAALMPTLEVGEHSGGAGERVDVGVGEEPGAQTVAPQTRSGREMFLQIEAINLILMLWPPRRDVRKHEDDEVAHGVAQRRADAGG